MTADFYDDCWRKLISLEDSEITAILETQKDKFVRMVIFASQHDTIAEPGKGSSIRMNGVFVH